MSDQNQQKQKQGGQGGQHGGGQKPGQQQQQQSNQKPGQAGKQQEKVDEEWGKMVEPCQEPGASAFLAPAMGLFFALMRRTIIVPDYQIDRRKMFR